MKKSWTSILNGAAVTADTAAEYVFEPDERVVKLPPQLDAKVAAIQKLMGRRVALEAEAHQIDIEIARHQDAIAEQLKAVGLVAKRPGGEQ